MERVIGRRIENGVTILTTDRSGDVVRNKLGNEGVYYYSRTNKFRADITQRKQKYFVGFFDNYEDALKARKVAVIKRDEGILEEWLKTKPHGNSEHYMDFWKNEFRKHTL